MEHMLDQSLRRSHEQGNSSVNTFKQWVFARMAKDIEGMVATLLSESLEPEKVSSVFFEACKVTREYFFDVLKSDPKIISQQMYNYMTDLLFFLQEQFPQDKDLQRELLFCARKNSEIQPSLGSKLFLAEIYLGQKNFLEAKIVYADILKSDPKNIDALIGMGQCFYELHESNSAEVLFQMAANIDPDDPRIYLYSAKIYLEKSKNDYGFLVVVERLYSEFCSCIKGCEDFYKSELLELLKDIANVYFEIYFSNRKEFAREKTMEYLDKALSVDSNQPDLAHTWWTLKNNFPLFEDVEDEETQEKELENDGLLLNPSPVLH